MVGVLRVSRRRWYAYGGPDNPRCFRRMSGGSWRYFITMR